jgi:hypothetical protein
MCGENRRNLLVRMLVSARLLDMAMDRAPELKMHPIDPETSLKATVTSTFAVKMNGLEATS